MGRRPCPAGHPREGVAVSSSPSLPAGSATTSTPSPVVSGQVGVALVPAAFTGFGNYGPRTGLVSRSQEPPTTCGQRPPTGSFLLESPLLGTRPAWRGRRGDSLGLCPPHPSGQGWPAPRLCACHPAPRPRPGLLHGRRPRGIAALQVTALSPCQGWASLVTDHTPTSGHHSGVRARERQPQGRGGGAGPRPCRPPAHTSHLGVKQRCDAQAVPADPNQAPALPAARPRLPLLPCWVSSSSPGSDHCPWLPWVGAGPSGHPRELAG